MLSEAALHLAFEQARHGKRIMRTGGSAGISYWNASLRVGHEIKDAALDVRWLMSGSGKRVHSSAHAAPAAGKHTWKLLKLPIV